jgi:FRG domain
MNTETCNFETLDDILRKNAHHRKPSQNHTQMHLSLWRGHSQDWKLLPSAFRDDKRALFSGVKKEKSLLAKLYLENLQQGVFGASSSHRIWETAAIAQHLGFPTRLLDWSRSPRIALWFAVCDRTEEAKKKDGVLWWARTLKPVKALFEDKEIFPPDPFHLGKEKYEIYETTIKNDRIKSQHGVFVVWGNPRQPFDLFCDEYKGGNEESPRLQCTKFIISASRKKDVFEQLIADGLDERIIKPDMEGLAEWIKRFNLSVIE